MLTRTNFTIRTVIILFDSLECWISSGFVWWQFFFSHSVYQRFLLQLIFVSFQVNLSFSYFFSLQMLFLWISTLIREYTFCMMYSMCADCRYLNWKKTFCCFAFRYFIAFSFLTNQILFLYRYFRKFSCCCFSFWYFTCHSHWLYLWHFSQCYEIFVIHFLIIRSLSSHILFEKKDPNRIVPYYSIVRMDFSVNWKLVHIFN